MRNPLTYEHVVEEIKLIPNDKLAEVYDFLHYFRLGLQQVPVQEATSARPRATERAHARSDKKMSRVLASAWGAWGTGKTRDELDRQLASMRDEWERPETAAIR